ncbi:MAG: hypothetical protein GY796_20935 [Chloroflexi bacterium]|nr:hypothetical protein [Chloroflexota bacterium]
MNRKLVAVGLLGLIWLVVVGGAAAQTPRPTPTNVAPTATPTNSLPITPTATRTPGSGNGDGQDNDQNKRGSISGFIYVDVNGDGRCVNTGIAGEEPITGIDVQFVSSDRETIIVNQSGEKGDFGLYAAGQSYWEIAPQPGSGWYISSDPIVYVPVYLETLNHENVNFCLAKGSGNAIINLSGDGAIVLLPESGAAAVEQPVFDAFVWIVGVAAVIGLFFLTAGLIMEYRRRSYLR